MPISTSSSNATFSIENSTLLPLEPNGSFVGKWEDVSQYAIIYTIWRTSVPGTLSYEFSIDGIEVDRVFPVETLDFTDGNFTSSGPRARFFRLKYENGTNRQTFLRLQTTYSLTTGGIGTVPAITEIKAKTNASVSSSISHGITPSNSFKTLNVTEDGTLVVTSDDAIRTSVLKTNKLVTSSGEEDQVILSYTPEHHFYLSGMGIYVWDIMTSSMAVFGEASLESPAGTKLYTSQMSSMGMGKDYIAFPHQISIPANQEVRIVCSPSDPNSQNWQANLIGSY